MNTENDRKIINTFNILALGVYVYSVPKAMMLRVDHGCQEEKGEIRSGAHLVNAVKVRAMEYKYVYVYFRRSL